MDDRAEEQENCPAKLHHESIWSPVKNKTKQNNLFNKITNNNTHECL